MIDTAVLWFITFPPAFMLLMEMLPGQHFICCCLIKTYCCVWLCAALSFFKRVHLPSKEILCDGLWFQTHWVFENECLGSATQWLNFNGWTPINRKNNIWGASSNMRQTWYMFNEIALFYLYHIQFVLNIPICVNPRLISAAFFF